MKNKKLTQIFCVVLTGIQGSNGSKIGKLSVWLSVDLIKTETWLIVNCFSSFCFIFAQTLMGKIPRALLKCPVHLQFISVLLLFVFKTIGNLFWSRSSVNVEWWKKCEFKSEISYFLNIPNRMSWRPVLNLKSSLCLILSSKIITCFIPLPIWQPLCSRDRAYFWRWDTLEFSSTLIWKGI